MEEYYSDQVFFYCKELKDAYRKNCGKLNYIDWVKRLFLIGDFRVAFAQGIYQRDKENANINELTGKKDKRYLLSWFLQVVHNPELAYEEKLRQAELIGALMLETQMSKRNSQAKVLTQEWILGPFISMLLQEAKITLLETPLKEEEWLTREQEQKNILELREELLVTDVNFRFGLFTVVDAKLRLEIMKKLRSEKPSKLWDRSEKNVTYSFLKWLAYIYEKELNQDNYEEKKQYLIDTMVEDGCKSQGRMENTLENLCPLLQNKRQEKLKDCTFGGCGFYKDCSLAGKDANLGIKKKKIIVDKVMKRYIDRAFDQEGGERSNNGAFIKK